MYKRQNVEYGSIEVNTSKEGEPMEIALERLMHNGEGSTTLGKDLIYTRPEEGIPYGTNIRDNKWDKAIERTNKVTDHARGEAAKTWDERKAEKERKKKEAMEATAKAKEESVQATPKTTD